MCGWGATGGWGCHESMGGGRWVGCEGVGVNWERGCVWECLGTATRILSMSYIVKK